jgi:hypothetical protein
VNYFTNCPETAITLSIISVQIIPCALLRVKKDRKAEVNRDLQIKGAPQLAVGFVELEEP